MGESIDRWNDCIFQCADSWKGELQLVFKVTELLVFRGQERCEAWGFESGNGPHLEPRVGCAGCVRSCKLRRLCKSDQDAKSVQLTVEGL